MKKVTRKPPKKKSVRRREQPKLRQHDPYLKTAPQLPDPEDKSAAFIGEGKCTPKQQLFAQEYIVDLNATQAAIRAGYAPSAAHVIGHNNLKKPAVKKAIQAAMDARATRTGITADRVLQEMARIGFMDPGQLYDANGDLRAMEDLPEDLRSCIKMVKSHVERGRNGEALGVVKEIKLHSKMRALELMAKHLNIMTENINLNSEINHKHNVQVDYSQLSNEELQLLVKLIGNQYLSEDEVCPGLTQ